MSENKETVGKFLDALTKGDYQQTLDCLTDDVEWEVPGMFHLRGKDAFGQELEHVGTASHDITRLTEESDVVVAEGTVRSEKQEGGFLNAMFCDVFMMKDAKIQRITSYLMEIK